MPLPPKAVLAPVPCAVAPATALHGARTFRLGAHGLRLLQAGAGGGRRDLPQPSLTPVAIAQGYEPRLPLAVVDGSPPRHEARSSSLATCRSAAWPARPRSRHARCSGRRIDDGGTDVREPDSVQMRFDQVSIAEAIHA